MNWCAWHSLKMVVTVSALAFAALTASAAHAESSAASLGVRSLDGEDELERRLSTALRSSAKASGDYSVSDKEASLEQLSLVNGCDEPDAPACLAQIARTLSVDKLLYGTVIGQGGAYELTLFVFDANTKATATMAAHGIPPDLLSATSAGDTVDKVLRRLLGKDVAAVPTPVATTGKLRIEGGVPGTEILLDGVNQGALDDQGLLLLDVPPGDHKVRPAGPEFSQLDERQAFVELGREATVTLGAVQGAAPEDELPPDLDEPPAPPAHSPSRLRRNIGLATIGVGVAFAIATIYSWVRIEHINHDGSYKEYRADFPKAGTPGGVRNVCGPASRGELAQRDPSDASLAALEHKADKLCGEADTLEALQYVFLSGAILGGGVGTYLVLSARDKRSPGLATTLRVNPRFGAQTAGLAATLSF
ncbi:MAG: hypothetical protein JWN48_1598 [Myxococcaceae bacterium]|nr:hypothetical protein [Myxococcaceae bacterium]